jgi:hypothetical protein
VEPEVEPLEEFRIPNVVRKVDVAERHLHAGAAGVLRDRKVEADAGGELILLGLLPHDHAKVVDLELVLEPVDGLDPALHELGAVGVAAPLVDKLLHVVHLSLPGLGLHPPALGPLLGRLDKHLVVPPVAGQPAAAQVDHVRADLVEEGAGVGDDDDRLGPLVLQEALEPQHRVEVQVVGGLVQQQHVGLDEQGPRQRHAHPPTPGEGPAVNDL